MSERTWSYYLEDINGKAVDERHNVPFTEAPSGEETRVVDGEKIPCWWHPALPEIRR